MTEEIRNAYQTLELPTGDNLPQVQKAWREMVKEWHPDRFSAGSDLQREAEERTKQINNAYDILKRYLIDGEIPRSRPRPSKQSQKQTRQTRSRPRSSTQSQKQESQQRTSRPRSRSSKQSKKQESQQETASEDAQSSQTHEQENRQKQTTKPFKEKSLAAKIGGIIFAIIFGAIIGYFIGGSIVFLLDWMIEAASGWSFIDRANPWIETFPNKTLIFFTLGAIFSRIDDEDVDWFRYIFFFVCGGTIGGMIGGVIDNEMGSAGIATLIGTLLGGACLVVAFGEYE